MLLKDLINESRMAELHLDAQEAIMRQFKFHDRDAEDTLSFALGTQDWFELSNRVREKLYSYYEKLSTDKEKSSNPDKFIRPALMADFKLK